MRRRELLQLTAGAALAAVAPAAARPAARAPVVLVTADTEAHVVAVGLRTGWIAAHLPTLAGPRSIEAVDRGRAALVAHTTLGAVTLIDPVALRVRRELGGFREPRYTAAHPDGRWAYVTDSLLGQVVVVDAPRGRVAARVEVGEHARHVTIDPAGRSLWVALGTKAPRLAVVDLADPARPRLRRTLPAVDLAHDVGFTADGGRVWVTSGARRRIAIHDARTLRPVALLAADAPPQHVVLLPHAVYATSGDDGTLRVHRPGGGASLHETAVPVGSYNVTAGLGRVVSPSLERGTLCVLDPGARLVRREVVARVAHDACVVPRT